MPENLVRGDGFKPTGCEPVGRVKEMGLQAAF